MYTCNSWDRDLNAYSMCMVLYTSVYSTTFSFKLVQCLSWDQGRDWCPHTSHITLLAPYHFVELWAVWAVVLEILHSLLNLGHASQVLFQPTCGAGKEKSPISLGRWKMKRKDQENGIWKGEKRINTGDSRLKYILLLPSKAYSHWSKRR